MGRLFGTDGIRGVSGSDLTAMTAYRLGLATANVLIERGILRPRVMIGSDTRLSRQMFESAIAAGLMAGGADAEVLGILPTPGVAWLIKETGADAGIMISASHNSAKYNGLKVFGADGYKLDDEGEEQIEKMILGEVSMQSVSYDRIGQRRDCADLVERYCLHVMAILKGGAVAENAKKRRILFDLSHGSATATAKTIFTPSNLYGFDADFIADSPDGAHINDGCGSTHMENLASAVVSGGYDMGFAFDGDADRCLAVDEKGNLIDGDMLIAAIAAEKQANGTLAAGTAVVTVLTNLAFKHFCAERGIKIALTDVGDRYVLREMLAIGAGIGGEQSGHIILPEYATTGDGQVTAAVALGLLAQSADKRASEVFGAMQPLPQVAVNCIVENDKKAAVLASPTLVEATNAVRERLGERGRVLIRPSGTEALVRIMLEGDDMEEITAMAKTLAEKVDEICGTL